MVNNRSGNNSATSTYRHHKGTQEPRPRGFCMIALAKPNEGANGPAKIKRSWEKSTKRRGVKYKKKRLEEKRIKTPPPRRCSSDAVMLPMQNIHYILRRDAASAERDRLWVRSEWNRGKNSTPCGTSITYSIISLVRTRRNSSHVCATERTELELLNLISRDRKREKDASYWLDCFECTTDKLAWRHCNVNVHSSQLTALLGSEDSEVHQRLIRSSIKHNNTLKSTWERAPGHLFYCDIKLSLGFSAIDFRARYRGEDGFCVVWSSNWSFWSQNQNII